MPQHPGGRSGRRRHRAGALLLALGLVLALAPGAWAAADNPLPRTYLGAAFGPGLRLGPTQFEQQSKMWFHDDAWWALMIEPTGTTLRVFELLPDHTWRPTRAALDAAPGDTGDALAQGDTTYVVFRRGDTTVQFARLGYDPAAREYTVAQPPVLVTDRGSAAPATIARDSTGRLWVAFVTATDVVVTYSNTDGRNWLDRPSQMLVPIPGNGPDRRPAGSLVAFDRSVGFLWTEQVSGTVRFGVHRDGDPPAVWTTETALTGPGLAGDEVNVKVVPGPAGASIVAAVKSLNGAKPQDPRDAPLIDVLLRGPDGKWSNRVAATVGDQYHSPLLQVDQTNRVVYLLADAAGEVHYKRAPLTALTFAPGPGSVFVQAQGRHPTDITGTKQPVTARTGLVALASGAADHFYQHGELALPGKAEPPDRPDPTPPTVPGDLVVRSGEPGSVSVSWSQARDGTRWSAAADQAPVAEYAVFRDGTEIGRTTTTSFGDVPPAAGRSYTYTVRAVDASGNLSGPASATVSVAEAGAPTGIIVGGVLLGAALVGGALLGIRRLRLTRSLRS